MTAEHALARFLGGVLLLAVGTAGLFTATIWFEPEVARDTLRFGLWPTVLLSVSMMAAGAYQLAYSFQYFIHPEDQWTSPFARSRRERGQRN